jgi:hypothetical protein
MCAAVISCVAAYLLIHAFGKAVLNEAGYWLLTCNLWCDSSCCKVCRFKSLNHCLSVSYKKLARGVLLF